MDNVNDVSNKKRFQSEGIDLIFRFKPKSIMDDNLEVKAEVKTSMKYIGSFFVETVSNTSKGTPAWLYTSKAERLFYLFWSLKKFYDTGFRELLALVKAYEWGLRKSVSYTRDTNSNMLYRSKDKIATLADLIRFGKFQVHDVSRFYEE